MLAKAIASNKIMECKAAWIRGAFLFLVVFGLLLVSGCSEQIADYKYKISVKVDTPVGVKSGQAVRRVVITKNSDWDLPDGRGFRTNLIGEAVAIKLPNNEMLFALMSFENVGLVGAAIIPEDWKPTKENGSRYKQAFRLITDSKGKAFELPADRREPGHRRIKDPKRISNYPIFARFSDMNDPKSLELVDPNDLADEFGEGYALKRIDIEITDDKISNSVLEILPWLESHRGSLVDPKLSQPKLSSITDIQFYRGEELNE